MEQSKHPLRCFCSRQPLLAMYGLDKRGRLYVHVRVYKQNRIYAETVCYGGEIKIRCRECIRWHRIIFADTSQTKVVLEESDMPAEIDPTPVLEEVEAAS